jgi:ATP-dependent DNA helicase RecG
MHLSARSLTAYFGQDTYVRFKASDKSRNEITNLIGEAVDRGRIKRKDESGGKKFAEYLPYWA